MSQYPECKHGHSDPMTPCVACQLEQERDDWKSMVEQTAQTSEALRAELEQVKRELALRVEQNVTQTRMDFTAIAEWKAEVDRIKVHSVIALQSAYAHGHYCDMGDQCPGCMAGRALEQITGRPWTQEECESQEFMLSHPSERYENDSKTD